MSDLWMTIDCPGCGCWGELYAPGSPEPNGPCLRCGGQWSRDRRSWTPGRGEITVRVRP